MAHVKVWLSRRVAGGQGSVVTSKEYATTHVTEDQSAPRSLAGRFRILGPGLVLAATSIGIGDLVAVIVAGGEYGTVFLWAVVLASILKYFLTEALGRWHLASGMTIIQGWDLFGRWATGFVTIYLILWAFIYGAAGPSVVGLAANAMVPALSPELWAVAHSVPALAVVWVGRYHLFETIMKVMIGATLLIVVFIAILLRPDPAELASGFVPTIPDGSLVYAVGIVGGLGGTLALAAYGYWLRDKGWRGGGWMSVMRLDTGVGYVVTAVFGVAVLVIGAEFFYGTDTNLGSDDGLPVLATDLGDRFGTTVEWLFLAGFWAIAFSSVMGVWNGMSYLFADLLRAFRGIPEEDAERYTSERSPAYRAFLLMLTFPPIPLILLGTPVGLVLFWTTLGAIFLPFLSITLLVLLNSTRVGEEYRSRRLLLSNIVLGASVVIFLFLASQAIIDLF